MPVATNKECWDMLEDHLAEVVYKRHGGYNGYRRAAVAVLISGGRDKDYKFLVSQYFKSYTIMAGLDTAATHKLILNTVEKLKRKNGAASFKRAFMEVL